MKTYLKNHWKSILIILLVVFVIGLIFYNNVLPKYNSKIATMGYNQALYELATNKAVPLFVTQNNETRIVSIGICSPEFLENYQAICGVGG